MDVFQLRNQLIQDYESYIRSFIHIKDKRINEIVEKELSDGLLWPDPLIHLNPSFEPGKWIDDLCDEGILHPECRNIFRIDKEEKTTIQGNRLRLYKHQEEAIRIATKGRNYVLTTGTGSGKSLSYIIPIVNHTLKHRDIKSIKAIVVYPMNALANSQYGELTKFLCQGYPAGKGPVTFDRYTGQESDEERERIIENTPDILLTNYVMLELILTRPFERGIVHAAQGLQFLILDELHTYRGRQGADVAMLVRRVRNLMTAEHMQCVGTSATIAGKGSDEEQKSEVAQIASMLFGADFSTDDIIGETLKRTTPFKEISDASFVTELTQRLKDLSYQTPKDFKSFISDPLSIWIESTFGLIKDKESGRLVRAQPKTISGQGGAAKELSNFTGVGEDVCEKSIQKTLLSAYQCEPNPDAHFPPSPFAFRLHQFFSRGDTVYASLEPESERYITVHGQKYVPNDRQRVLLPLVFCRECGQEYYCVRLFTDTKTNQRKFEPRELDDTFTDDESEAGFLYYNSDKPWSLNLEEVQNRVPDEWLEEYSGTVRIRRNRLKDIPQNIRIGLSGLESNEGIEYRYAAAPFRFCLNCGISYGFRQRSDFGKLTSLASGGRSTATTIMSLSIIRNLLHEETLPEKARKLLSFTDNRQDASLQAGHFNDFIEIGILRSALYKAVSDKGSEGLRHDEITQKIFQALNLPFESYALNPNERYTAKTETERTFRDVLGYRLYCDLKRGWRITSPNLEQCGLLEIDYLSLDDLCKEEDEWMIFHPALREAKPEIRFRAAKTLLDYIRRELTIQVDYLDQSAQERIMLRNNQRLAGPWAVDENEQMVHSAIAYPRSRRKKDYRGNVFISTRGGFGQYLRRRNTFPEYSSRLSLEDIEIIISQLLQALSIAGIVTVVSKPGFEDEVPGYQLQAAAMIWKAGEGTKPFHDIIHVPNIPEEGGQVNPFFIDFYRTIASDTKGIEAREHTAQVSTEERIMREKDFREGKLPILFCSPTMELGVDISELNVVNLRNIPPTPANYAQRSGRAGRSGQPALVFSYCTTGSPHDQYFFKRPDLMVSGAVTPPRIDLANEDLIRAHVHAIWLTETGQGLGTTLCDILDVGGEEPTLKVQESVLVYINDRDTSLRAFKRAQDIFLTIKNELEVADWYGDNWLDEVFVQVVRNFNETCNRWRSLYRAAMDQAARQDKIIRDASRNYMDKETAQRLRREAEAQLRLLTESGNVIQSDFYSYRYFASEGFLPGYNFPRLPLSAYIPGRRRKRGHEEFLSRPRFLAISEFGPQAVIYHEGSRYITNKVILPVEEDGVIVTNMKHCKYCGYLHPESNGNSPDLCERCQKPLTEIFRDLIKMQNVSTKRREKINSDEEERIRLGYEIKAGFRFAVIDGRPACKTSIISKEDVELAKITYGHAATLYRINLGWTRRKNKNKLGYVLDFERGYWAKVDQDIEEDPEDPLSKNTKRVIPYVEDRKNCLLFEPSIELKEKELASLQSALKTAIQVCYQIEDNELAAEPLPDADRRKLILFYESAEGGAGVLRRLIDDTEAFGKIAREALALCHYDPDTGEDQKRAPGFREDCEAACYNCLMTYRNQRDHKFLDRKAIKEILLDLANATVRSSPKEIPRSEHFDMLSSKCESELERKWLIYLENNDLNLPSHAQKFIDKCNTRPDFYYEGLNVAVYIDGPVHKYPERQLRDSTQVECMEDYGYTIIRFASDEDWNAIIDKYPNIFGRLT